MRIAITGASGHIGNNLCRALLLHGHQINALVRNQDDETLNKLPLQIFRGDLMKKEVLDSILQDVDLLIHLAAIVSINPAARKKILYTNIEGPEAVVNACLRNKVKRIIHFSSIHAHKASGPMIEIDENTEYVSSTKSAYDYSKARGEAIMLNARSKGLDITIINPTGVLGPNDYKPSLTGQLLIKIIQGKMQFLVDSGFDWVDVRDVANATVKIVEQNMMNEKILLSGHWKSLKELGDTALKVLDRKYKSIVLPVNLAYIGLPIIKLISQLKHNAPLYTGQSLKAVKEGSRFVSHRRANKLIDYEPRAFEETLRDTVDWLTHKYLLKDE